MKYLCFAVFLITLTINTTWARDCPVKKSNSKIFCYYSKFNDAIDCSCSHVILPADADVKSVERAKAQTKGGVKVLVTVNEFNQGLLDLLKSTKVDGLEISLQKLDTKEDINDFISTVKSKIGTDLYLALSVPAKAELLAKYYDFKALSKHADVFILQTAFLGASKNVTFHPSRLSGLWDMQNTDSIVDLVSGLGAPLSKVVITAPVQAFQFTLQNEEFSAPGSPALELKSITRNELCTLMSSGANWTLERDQDQAGPYIFSKNQWIAFEDASSIDIKAKYSRIRGLAGLALKDLSQDGGNKCGPTILEAAYEGLSRQARAPRGAVLHSLEREIQESSSRPLDSVQLSPYRISRVIDTEGHWHVIREDTRTEFTCSRQGYFVHPRSCNRFYRCVKFDQRSEEFSVFEFDCPAGLAFDERVEVCVWPGSLPEGKPCSGSSEIAPVPKERFVCPHEPGYYADPENCRWFFACMDQGDTHLIAYEFRCPYGLVYDSERLLCEWPWLVPKCASGSGLGINLNSQFIYGSNSADLEHYNGLGSLGAIKLGGITGPVQQPIIYTNIGGQFGHAVHGLSSLGYNAQLSLQRAGLINANNAPIGGVSSGQHFGNIAGSGVISGAYGSTGESDTNYNQYNSGGGVSLGINAKNNVGYAQSSYQNLDASHEQGGANYQYNSGNLHSQQGNNGILSAISSSADSVVSSQNYGDASYEQGAATYQFNSGKLNSQQGYNGIISGTSSGATDQYQKVITSHGDASKEQGSATYQYNSGNLHPQQGYNGIVSGTDLTNAQYQTVISSQDHGDAKLNAHYNLGGQVAGQIQDNLNVKLSHSLVGNSEEGRYSQNSNEANQVLFQQNLQHEISNLGNNQNIIREQQYTNQNSDQSDNLYVLNQATVDKSYHGALIQSGDLNTAVHQIYAGGNVGAVDGHIPQIPSSQYQNEAKALNTISNIDTQSGIRFGGSSSGATSSSSFVQYHPVNQQENINIVGGGYSAIGASKSGVEITNNGENYAGISQSTVSPIVTTYAVPTVTSVPLPTLKTATGFTSYNGGVIANIPQYQFRYESRPEYSNISADFVKIVSTTPSTLVISNYEKANNENKQAVYSGESSYQQTSYGNNGGYVYAKPNVVFEEGQVINNVDQHEIKVNTDILNNFQNVQTYDRNNGGYVYKKPSLAFEEERKYVVSTTARPAVTYAQTRPVQVITPSSVTYIEQNVKQQNQAQTSEQQYTGYVYSNPTTKFEVTPQSVYSYSTTLKPATLANNEQTVSTGYSYQQPEISFKELVQPQVSLSIPNEVSTIRPQVFVPSTPVPIVQQKVPLQPVTSYSYINNEAATYNKDDLTISKQPIYQQHPEERIISRFSIRKPNVESNYVQPTIATYGYEKAIDSGYHYEQPAIKFEERPQPVVPVSIDTTYGQHNTNKNSQTAVVSSYFYQKPSISQYNYKDIVQTVISKEQPEFTYLPAKQPSAVYPTIPSTNIVGTKQDVYSYSYVKPTTPKVQYLPPATVQPAVLSTYSYETPTTTAKSVPVPPSTIQSVKVDSYPTSYTFHSVSNTPKSAQKQYNVQFKGYDYPKPDVTFVEEPQPVVTTFETRKPIVEIPFVKKQAYVTGDKEYQYTYENFESQKENTRSQSYNQASRIDKYPIQEVYINTTPRPTYSSTVASVLAGQSTYTTESPNFYYYDSRLSSTPKAAITEGYNYPKPTVAFEETPIIATTYLPTTTKDYVPVTTTRRPLVRTKVPELAKTYLPVKSQVKYITTAVPAITYPSSTYLPMRKYSTSVPSLEYLPQSRVRITTTTGTPDEIQVTTRRPSKVIKVVRPKVVKTIIKQNDIHPILSTKLGAQCTCTSNNLKLRKNQRVIIVEDEDDGYEVENSYDDDNYYESQKLVDITPTPKVYIKSTTGGIEYSTTAYSERQRTEDVSTRYESVDEQEAVIVRKKTKPAPSDKEIADAVRTGLKLVKQAAKEGAREGAEEAIRSDRVRDTIECQRAGLFRHPNKCNKFYACRWDCTKNKFTLHTFNCPVHLTFDSNLGACNWPSQGPACMENTLLPSA